MTRSLYPWQIEAIDNWETNDYVGVIEAVTGSGKTQIALEIIKYHLQNNWKIAILVPTIPLVEQWLNEIRNQIKLIYPRVKVGKFRGFTSDLENHYDIVIGLPHKASKNCIIAAESTHKFLIIADECHRYGSEKWSYSLEDGFERRLGITATLERNDDGVDKILLPYFDKIVFSLDYERALAENCISKFKIGFLEVSFNPHELEKFEKLDRELKKLRKKLINMYGVTPEPFGNFLDDLKTLAANNHNYQARDCARYYFSNFSQRSRLLASADNKFEKLKTIAPAVINTERTILFTQTIEAAEFATEIMKSRGVCAVCMHSKMNNTERANVFIDFENGHHELIAAPRLLDEGVNVPSADFAIILASSKTKRQMIQRMGRVLRKDPEYEDKLSKILIVFVKDTSEDPRSPYREDFIYLIANAAEEVTLFAEDADLDDILDFFEIEDCELRFGEGDDFDAVYELELARYEKREKKLLNNDSYSLTPALGIADSNNSNDFFKLVQAIRSDDIETVKSIIESGTDINIKSKNNSTALIASAEYDNYDITEWLLKSGADPNILNDDGYTALHYAVINNNDDITVTLLLEDVDINVLNDDGKSPMLLAYENKNLLIFEMILVDCPDIDVRYKDGLTLLMKAIKDNAHDFIELLFRYDNPDLNVVDSNGDTAYDYAEKYKCTKFQELVRDNEEVD
jgi:superfamily II DNA or RNA helicase